MTSAVSGRFSKKATGLFTWPPPNCGVHLAVCESPLASYSVVVGLSNWALVDPLAWIYFRPERRVKGRAFGDLCGETERLTLCRGLNPDARRDAQRIFERICARLRALAEKEGGG